MSRAEAPGTDDSRILAGDGDAALDGRLEAELGAFNARATRGVPEQRELTVRAVDPDGELLGGVSGWTWDEAAGIALTWVAEAGRGRGVGARMLARFEAEAAARGVRRVFVTSFSFQAPAFYERHGYVELFRWEGVPREGMADVHLRKEL